MKVETSFTAEEAVTNGFMTEVVGTIKAVALLKKENFKPGNKMNYTKEELDKKFEKTEGFLEKILNKLKEKYGTKVEFVGISADKEFMTYYHFMQNNKKYNFTNLHWGNNTDLIENYDVKAFPTFVLIGPDGKIVQYPAIAPSKHLDEY